MAQLSEPLARDAIRRIRSNQLHCLTANEIDQALWAWLMLNGYEPRPTQETSLTPAEEESLRERSDLMHRPAEY